MLTRCLSAVLFAAVLGAGSVQAGPAKAPPEPATVKAIIAQWKGREVRVVRDGDKVDVKVLLKMGDDFFAIDAADGGTTYYPLGRVRAVTVQGDKLFVHVN
jgi:hypothetical protein